jgi:hypothetical protein
VVARVVAIDAGRRYAESLETEDHADRVCHGGAICGRDDVSHRTGGRGLARQRRGRGGRWRGRRRRRRGGRCRRGGFLLAAGYER